MGPRQWAAQETPGNRSAAPQAHAARKRQLFETVDSFINAAELSKKIHADFDRMQKYGTPLATLKTKYKSLWCESHKDDEDLALLVSSIDSRQASIITRMRTVLADDIKDTKTGDQPRDVVGLLGCVAPVGCLIVARSWPARCH